MLSRLCFASALVLAVVAAPVAVQAQATLPPVTVTGITINSVTSQAGQLVANATVALNVVGRNITLPATIPLTPSVGGTCDILNLTLGPIHLDLLGLVVDVDNCAGGPVTVSITGEEGQLLGNLLCGVANLVNPNGSLNLGVLLSPLNAGVLSTLGTALTSDLQKVINNFFQKATVTTGSGHMNGVCDILDLSLAPIHLDLLGLVADTSAICVSVTAVPGPGKLLGNLLCSLEDLLNNRGNNAHAEAVLIGNILRVLNSL